MNSIWLPALGVSVCTCHFFGNEHFFEIHLLPGQPQGIAPTVFILSMLKTIEHVSFLDNFVLPFQNSSFQTIILHMRLQVLQDGFGNATGIFVPLSDWNTITEKHEDLKALVQLEPSPKKKLSELAGTLSHETAKAMLDYVAESRNEWEERLSKQF